MYLRFNRVTYYFLEDPIYQKITARMQRSVLVEISPAILLHRNILVDTFSYLIDALACHFNLPLFDYLVSHKRSTPQLLFKDLECTVSLAEEGIQHLIE